MTQNSKATPIWHPDLAARGYKDPLLVPIPAVQATIAAMSASKIHQFIQINNLEMLDKGELVENGETLLLLNTLDLGHWMRIFEFANTDLPKAMQRLRDMQLGLRDIANRDLAEYEEARGQTITMEQYLKNANPQAPEPSTSSEPGPSQLVYGLDEIDENGQGLAHPFLRNLGIDEAHKAAIEDVHESF